MNYPDVPDAPGVPPLLRDPESISYGDPNEKLESSDETDSSTANKVWGIFDDMGLEVITPDTFVGLRYTNSTRVSNYPLEQGAFESYNKVNDPFEVAITLAVGGSDQKRSEFLALTKAIAGTLNLYTVVTPEETFPSVNIERYDYSRTAHNGVGVVSVNFYFKQIRLNAVAEFTNQTDSTVSEEAAEEATTVDTADTGVEAESLGDEIVENPASASAINIGQVQARVASLAESASAVVNNVKSAVSGAINTVVDAVNQVVDIKNTINTATAAVQNIQGAITGVTEALHSIEGIKVSLGGAVAAIRGVQNAVSTARGISGAMGALGNVSNSIQSLLQVKDAAATATNAINSITGATSGITGALASIQNIQNNVSKSISTVQNMAAVASNNVLTVSSRLSLREILPPANKQDPVTNVVTNGRGEVDPEITTYLGTLYVGDTA